MDLKIFPECLDDIEAKMKKISRQILLFTDNCLHHLVDVQLSNVKLVFFSANTKSIVQPLDQGVIDSFKCHCRQMLVRHTIAQCTTICSVDKITVMALDAILWIGMTWKKVTDTTISNCFLAGGFSRTLSDQQTFQNEALPTNDGSSQDPIKQLDDILSHVHIDDN